MLSQAPCSGCGRGALAEHADAVDWGWRAWRQNLNDKCVCGRRLWANRRARQGRIVVTDSIVVTAQYTIREDALAGADLLH